ncbi:hypothetical protein [Burkholderia cepacia]|uniref:hypothetical protein n=1 Tax=Burkholderia cepacia TaxID=292 RepID=UPI003C7E3482
MRPSVRPYGASCRIVTGPLSDRWGRKGLIVAGMRVPAARRAPAALTGQLRWRLVASVLPGLGTAMVCPGLIAAVSDASDASGPGWWACSLSVYRFWRDPGCAIRALPANGWPADSVSPERSSWWPR